MIKMIKVIKVIKALLMIMIMIIYLTAYVRNACRYERAALGHGEGRAPGARGLPLRRPHLPKGCAAGADRPGRPGCAGGTGGRGLASLPGGATGALQDRQAGGDETPTAKPGGGVRGSPARRSG